MKNSEEYCLIKFHKKTGKIDTTLEAVGYEQLKKWAIKAIPKTKDSIIFNKSTGEIVFCISGSSDGGKLYTFEHSANIEDFCYGLLATINA